MESVIDWVRVDKMKFNPDMTEILDVSRKIDLGIQISLILDGVILPLKSLLESTACGQKTRWLWCLECFCPASASALAVSVSGLVRSSYNDPCLSYILDWTIAVMGFGNWTTAMPST